METWGGGEPSREADELVRRWMLGTVGGAMVEVMSKKNANSKLSQTKIS